MWWLRANALFLAGWIRDAMRAPSHLLPHRSALSDSYPQIHADAVSWAAVLLEIGAALLLATAGTRALRRASSAGARAAVGATAGRSTV